MYGVAARTALAVGKYHLSIQVFGAASSVAPFFIQKNYFSISLTEIVFYLYLNYG